jgi:hypothetical protein
MRRGSIAASLCGQSSLPRPVIAQSRPLLTAPAAVTAAALCVCVCAFQALDVNATNRKGRTPLMLCFSPPSLTLCAKVGARRSSVPSLTMQWAM